MSIPQRLYRIARHKLEEVKLRLDTLDEEALRELEREQARARQKTDAQRELDDAMIFSSDNNSSRTSPSPTGYPPRKPEIPNNVPNNGTRLRTPQEIANGKITPQPQEENLDFHYLRLGLTPGADYLDVQAAYTRFAERCDPSRFPAGSQEEQEAKQIKARLDESYHALRDVLDPMARRFDLLELFEDKNSNKENKKETKKEAGKK